MSAVLYTLGGLARLILEEIEKKQAEGWSLVEIADHYITARI